VELFKYAEKTLPSQNYTHEEIKSSLNLGNACCYLFYYSKRLYIKLYVTIMLPVVFYGCETWSLDLREKHRVRVFESRVLRRTFWPKRARHEACIGERRDA
jgi:hypothetical protein